MVDVHETEPAEALPAPAPVPARSPDVDDDVRPLAALLVVRVALGLAFVAWLVPLSIDDYFRVYHAIFFWQKPSFSPSTNWLPLYVWLQGPLVGITGETLFVPRLASLVLGLVGARLSVRDADDPRERRARFVLAVCAPTSVLLFSIPLSEALFGALVTTYVASLARYLERGRAIDACLASLALLGASATRYEAWAAIPLLPLLLARRVPVDARRAVVVSLALLPIVFPLRWMAHLAERTGDPFSFLGAIERDQFGASPLAVAFVGPSAPLALAFVAALAALVYGVRPGESPRVRLASAHGLLFVAFAGLLALADSLPSQLPARLFHVPILLAVPAAVAWLLRAESRASWRVVLAVAALGLVLGTVSAATMPGVLRPRDAALGLRLRARLAADPTAAAVIEGPFPEVASFVVAASAVGRVHVDGAGGRCRASVVRCEFRCARPAWVDSVRYFVVASGGLTRTLVRQGYHEVGRSGRYRLLERGPSSPPLCPGR